MRKYRVMRWRDWLGVGERRWKKAPDEEVQPAKTLWDWLQLLIVPAMLIGVTFVWSGLQTRSDNKREDRRVAADRAAADEARQGATLQSYLDQMSGLMLHEKLLTSKEGDAVRAVARTVTLATLRRLEGERKAAVITFLYEARLLGVKNPRVLLNGADLEGANLADTNLVRANLAEANLRSTNLVEARLRLSNLDGATLDGADLTGMADLAGVSAIGAHFRGANLTDAYLRQADLEVADLSHAILVGADLEGADLSDGYLDGADLRGADLREAKLLDTELDGANLEGADFQYALINRASFQHAHLNQARNLDLDELLSDVPSADWLKRFLVSQKAFLDSLSPDELAEFNLSPEKLAKFRREASGG
jgi:uncharacterized protein YjbI with pentapeptide repeats